MSKPSQAEVQVSLLTQASEKLTQALLLQTEMSELLREKKSWLDQQLALTDLVNELYNNLSPEDPGRVIVDRIRAIIGGNLSTT